MNVDAFVDKQRSIQRDLLQFFDESDENIDIIQKLKKYQLQKDKYELKLFLYFILNISNNHQRLPSFFAKIEEIIQFYKKDILELYSNYDIFRIFRQNKRILLYVIQEQMLFCDDYILNCLKQNEYKNQKYYDYLFNSCDDDKSVKNGENESYICQMIRDDSVVDFITYVNKTNFPLSSKIKTSKFETNLFLLKNWPNLIEYAAFFGSIQIFRYLLMNNVDLTENIWRYAIHGRNPDLIHLIEENGINPTGKCIKESIKCHHHEITEYLLNNYPNECEEEELNYFSSIKFYNFEYFPKSFKNDLSFCYLCEYDYYPFVENILKTENVNYMRKLMYKSDICYCYTKKTLPQINAVAKRMNVDILSLLFKQNDLVIGDFCFFKCDELLEIVIPSSITLIGSYSFQKCYLLEKITIPSSVEIIGEYAFDSCISLKQISIPSSVISIGRYAFNKCSSLKQISILSSITSNSEFAFNKCPPLIEISIPSSITSIGKYSFLKSSLLNQLSIHSSDTSISEFAFNKCSSLIEISIPSSITSIGKYAFSECSSLKQISIPSSVTSIGEYAFSECSSLTQISIPSSVTSIGKYAFNKCSSLVEISIPSSVTSIGKYAFSECSSLKQISIPSSIASIGKYTFGECSSLKQITIPSSVTSIDKYAFCECSSLIEISIPSSVTSIGKHAFLGCSSLVEISIPSSITSIGKYTFYRCSSLIEISIPPSVTVIKRYAFLKCSSLIHITIPSSVKSIG